MQKFLVGVNYWPVSKGMAMWRLFDPGEVREDMARISDMKLSPVRIFLLWEDFQPDPRRINLKALDHLADTARFADDAGVNLWVTLFTGHMSGANWFPEWMLDLSGSGEIFFPIASGSSLLQYAPKNPYHDSAVVAAQKLFIREVTATLRGYPSLWGWDLGNEPSNAYRPRTREAGRAWLSEIVGEIRRDDKINPVTIGLHQQDLAEDLRMGPEDAAAFCDMMTMHAYPAYADWAGGKTDPLFPLYLVELTRWLSGGKEVLLSEFGISTGNDPLSTNAESAATYAATVLEILRKYGIPGALWWNYGDCAKDLWRYPPFRELLHERSFGLLHNDFTPKQTTAVIENANRVRGDDVPPRGWIDLEPEEYWMAPERHIRRLYARFRDLFSGLTY